MIKPVCFGEQIVPSIAPPQAHLASFSDTISHGITYYPQAIQTAQRGLLKGQTRDHQLAELNDATRQLGVAMIAGLGSVGASPWGILPKWLGAASWLASQKITELLVNGLVFLRTGQWLGKWYVSSQGEVKRLYQDPQFFAFETTMPQEKQFAIAKSFDIPLDHPDRDSLLLSKMRELSVKTQTWWMLMAGFSTPVMTAAICNTVEPLIQQFLTYLRIEKASNKVENLLKAEDKSAGLQHALEKEWQAYLGPSSQAVRQQMFDRLKQEHAVPQQVVEPGVSRMRLWWDRFLTQIPKALNVNPVDYLDPKTGRLDETGLIKHLISKRHDSEWIDHLLSKIEYAERASAEALYPLTRRLLTLKNMTEKLSEKPHQIPLMTQVQYHTLYDWYQAQRQASMGTVSHFRLLIQTLKNTQGSDQELMMKMEKILQSSSLGNVLKALFSDGQLDTAKQLAGGQSQLEAIIHHVDPGHYGKAFIRMGASPREFLEQAFHQAASKKRWLSMYPKFWGGLMLGASIIFAVSFLGKKVNVSQPFSPSVTREPSNAIKSSPQFRGSVGR